MAGGISRRAFSVGLLCTATGISQAATASASPAQRKFASDEISTVVWSKIHRDHPPVIHTKLFGGNIVVKPGYNWQHLFAEWDWANWIKPQIDRAIALGMNAVRLIGGPQAIWAQWITWPKWAPSIAYSVDHILVNEGRAYRCIAGGSSAPAGGPAGSGSAIPDGTVTWEYVRENTLTPLTQEEYDSHWIQLVEYCASKGLSVYPCLCTIDDFDAFPGNGFQTKTPVMDSIVTTAQRLSYYANVVAFEVFQEGDYQSGLAWQSNNEYFGGRVNNVGKSYDLASAGRSAPFGGPTGTGTGIVDGTCVWNYFGVRLYASDVLALLADLRRVSKVPIAISSSYDNPRFWDGEPYIQNLVLADPNGTDFIDIHYPDSLSTLESYALRYQKPVLIGEYSLPQATIVPIHNLEEVMGTFVWSLADFGNDPTRQSGVWDNTGFQQMNSTHPGEPLSTVSGQRSNLVAILRQMSVSDFQGGR